MQVSEPKYYGYNFNFRRADVLFPAHADGPQPGAVPGYHAHYTPESKLMQYAAVWSPDGQGIVQIGLEPTRVLEAMKKERAVLHFSLW